MTKQELAYVLMDIAEAGGAVSLSRHPAYKHWCAALTELHPHGEQPVLGWTLKFARQLHTQHGVPAEQIIAVASLTIGTPHNPER
jgi:hypothetical protein